MVGSAFELDENDALSTRPQSAMASPSYLRDSGLNTKGESQTCAKARMDAPGRGVGPAGLSRRPVVCAGRRLLSPPQNDRRTRRTDFRESFLLSSALCSWVGSLDQEALQREVREAWRSYPEEALLHARLQVPHLQVQGEGLGEDCVISRVGQSVQARAVQAFHAGEAWRAT